MASHGISIVVPVSFYLRSHAYIFEHFPEWTALDNGPTNRSVPYLPCNLRIARLEREVSACGCGRLDRVVGGGRERHAGVGGDEDDERGRSIR